MIRFKAILITVGKKTIIQLPKSASEALPSRSQVFVKGTMNGHSFEKVLEPDGKSGHWFEVDKKLHDSLKIDVGDQVTLEIEPSKQWPEPTVPTDFRQALTTAPSDVQAVWSTITPMARWEWIRWVTSTNVVPTRERRVEVSISKMQSGKRRPCCFNRASCTDPDLAKNGKLIEQR